MKKNISKSQHSQVEAPEQKNIHQMMMIHILNKHFEPVWEDELFHNIGMRFDRETQTLTIGQWWKRSWLWKATVKPKSVGICTYNASLIDDDYWDLICKLKPELFSFLWEDKGINYFEYGKLPKVA